MDVKINVTHVNFYYGNHQALYDVTVKIRPQCVTALIGPSGCGKSTFLRSLNRMNDLIPGVRLEGKVELDGDTAVSRTLCASIAHSSEMLSARHRSQRWVSPMRPSRRGFRN